VPDFYDKHQNSEPIINDGNLIDRLSGPERVDSTLKNEILSMAKAIILQNASPSEKDYGQEIFIIYEDIISKDMDIFFKNLGIYHITTQDKHLPSSELYQKLQECKKWENPQTASISAEKNSSYLYHLSSLYENIKVLFRDKPGVENQKVKRISSLIYF